MIFGRRAAGYPGKGLFGGPKGLLRVVVHRELCTGCGDCMAVCVNRIIRIDGKGRARIGRNCRGCGRCAAACPESALTVRAR